MINSVLNAKKVADILANNKELILKKWEAVLCERLPEAEATPVNYLRDSIPTFIDELSDFLRAAEDTLAEINSAAKKHGKDRNDNTDFSIEQVVYEFFVLKNVIFNIIDESGDAGKDVYRKISSVIDLGIQHSVKEYAMRSSAAEAKSRAEKELTLKRLSQAVEVAQLGFYEWDIPSDVIYFSSKMQEDWGISAGITLDKTIELLHPDDRELTMKLINDSIRSGSHYINKFRVRRPDGREIWILAQGQVTYDDNGEPLKFLGTSLDISEEKNNQLILQQAQLEAEEREISIREIANTLPQIVWTARPDGILDWYNERWYEYTDMKPGTNWDDPDGPMYPDDIPIIHKRWKESRDKGTPYEMEYRIKQASDQKYRWHVSRALPVRDEKGNILKWVGTTTNIDSQKELQQELREEREVRERFVAALSHDLRTPLTAIKLSAATLVRKHGENKSIEDSANKILNGVNRAEKMVKDLLDANLLKAGQSFPLNLKETSLDVVMDQTISDLANLYGDRFHFAIENHIQGMWDGEALQRVIENLASNAVKYGDGSLIQIHVHRKGDGVEFNVHNFGNPIHPDDQRVIFETYQRTSIAFRSGQKGWGIGLTLVKGIIEAHHGKIAVSSFKESGTNFKVWIPLDSRI